MTEGSATKQRSDRHVHSGCCHIVLVADPTEDRNRIANSSEEHLGETLGQGDCTPGQAIGALGEHNRPKVAREVSRFDAQDIDRKDSGIGGTDGLNLVEGGSMVGRDPDHAWNGLHGLLQMGRVR